MMKRLAFVVSLLCLSLPVLAQYSGAVVGNPTFGPAKFSNGLTATSDSSYISLPSGVLNVTPSNSWTVEAWLKTTSPSIGVAFFIAQPGQGQMWVGSLGNGDFAFAISGTSGSFTGNPLDSGKPINDGNWHHCVMQMSSGNTLTSYVDGIAGGTFTGAATTFAGGGIIGDYGWVPGYSWHGSIDEVAIWTVARYSGNFTPPTQPYLGTESSLQALYHLQSDGTDSQTTVLSLTTSLLPGGTTGAAYNQTLAASGGPPPYTWAIYSGSLPAGLSLASSTGVISGTPTAVGTSNFVAQVTDATGANATAPLSITISAVTILTTSLPGGTAGAAYSQTLAASGGATPYSWSIYSGSLPAGLSLTAATGAIGGTPTTAGTGSFVAKVTDATGRTATASLSITIGSVSVTTSALPSGTAGTAYSQTLAASGGTTPYTWSISSGSLPSGLSLAAASGVISGTPTAAGSSSFVAKATDANGIAATASLSITISNPAYTTIAPNSPAILYSPYNWVVTGNSATTINSGAYLRTIFSGTSVALLTNTANNVSLPYSELWARIDGDAWEELTLSAGNPALSIATGLQSRNHLLEVIVKSTSETISRWASNSASMITITGLQLDSGAAVEAPLSRSKHILIYGDSITEGVRTVNGTATYDTDRNDVLSDYSYALATAMDAEVGIVGFGASGITVGGSGGVPPLTSSYNYVYSGAPRSFSPAPDLVIYNEGTNDGGNSITSGLETVIQGIKALAPNAKQLVLVPFNQTHISDIQAAVTAIGSPNVTYSGTAGWFNPADSSDGLHPYGYSHLGFIAPQLFPVVDNLLY